MADREGADRVSREGGGDVGNAGQLVLGDASARGAEPVNPMVQPNPELGAMYSRPSMVSERVLRYLLEQGGPVSLDTIGDALGIVGVLRAHLALSLKDSAKENLVVISRRAEDDFQYRYVATQRCADLIAWVDAPGPDPSIPSSTGSLHNADCPMTNSDEASRTVCTCDSLERAFGFGTRDTPEGGPVA